VSADRAELRRRAARVLLLPWLLLTVALLGGVRVAARDRALVFLPPPLITLVMAALLMALFMRARLILPARWLSARYTMLENASHAVTLAALFFASAQAFNSVLPERGLLYWIFAAFFLWTLWNDQFAPFDPGRLLRSLAVLFATAFALKHLLLGGLHGGPEAAWSRRLLSALLEGVTLGTLDLPAFAAATGYISFFTLALYVAALALVRPSPEEAQDDARRLLADYRALGPSGRAWVRDAIDDGEPVLLAEATDRERSG
jgi:hypothetical protein